MGRGYLPPPEKCLGEATRESFILSDGQIEESGKTPLLGKHPALDFFFFLLIEIILGEGILNLNFHCCSACCLIAESVY